MATIIFPTETENAAMAQTSNAPVLTLLREIQVKVEESLKQGADNGNELRSLRRELGLDGQHGRLPTLEAAVNEFKVLLPAVEARLDVRMRAIETDREHTRGRKELVTFVLLLLSSSAGAAILGMVAKMMGLLH